MRFVFRPTNFPAASTMAPPDDPGASGAVCSTLPAIRRPPGPRNERETDETSPNVTRTPPPNDAAMPNTGEPTASPSPAPHSMALAPVVSTETTARSPSGSTPVTVPRAERPLPNVTVTSPPRRLWALVRTWPSAMTTPDPRALRPIVTMDGPAVVATDPTAAPISSIALMSRWTAVVPNRERVVTCDLQVTTDGMT